MSTCYRLQQDGKMITSLNLVIDHMQTTQSSSDLQAKVEELPDNQDIDTLLERFGAVFIYEPTTERRWIITNSQYTRLFTDADIVMFEDKPQLDRLRKTMTTSSHDLNEAAEILEKANVLNEDLIHSLRVEALQNMAVDQLKLIPIQLFHAEVGCASGDGPLLNQKMD